MQTGEIIGAIGGSIGIAKTAWDAYQWWKNRGRIEINLVRLDYHVIRYPAGTGPLRSMFGPPGGTIHNDLLLDNRPKSAFTILEFEIRNRYRDPVTVGLIQVDDWMFSERYYLPMYYPPQNYRVFDLYTRESVSLAPYHKLDSQQVLGRRVEIVEISSGPLRLTHRQRVHLPERDRFVIRTVSSRGMVTSNIHVHESVHEYEASVFDTSGLITEDMYRSQQYSDGLSQFISLSRWSGQELIPGGEPSSGGEPRP